MTHRVAWSGQVGWPKSSLWSFRSVAALGWDAGLTFAFDPVEFQNCNLRGSPQCSCSGADFPPQREIACLGYHHWENSPVAPPAAFLRPTCLTHFLVHWTFTCVAHEMTDGRHGRGDGIFVCSADINLDWPGSVKRPLHTKYFMFWPHTHLLRRDLLPFCTKPDDATRSV